MRRYCLIRVIGGSGKPYTFRIQGLTLGAQMNRFAAMDTCIKMAALVTSTDSVGADLATVILQNPEYFLKNIELVNLKTADIKHAVASINKS